ncbi:hypothetical protein FRB95_005288 [Tulasnella sp. JGI-2019a]|nr:hypothetical protein FRB95_005288 [Tulasnella sp. JGI-2019a]
MNALSGAVQQLKTTPTEPLKVPVKVQASIPMDSPPSSEYGDEIWDTRATGPRVLSKTKGFSEGAGAA